ncbi:MAG: DNA helicase, partial [Firmicutes bacterium]|nr:DNA helicase [Bacillota bacterium]
YAKHADLLVIDELGTESKNAYAYSQILSLIDTRYRAKKPLIITTNLVDAKLRNNLKTIDQKTNLIDDDERIYNRISEMCSTIKLNIPSYRIAQSKRKEADFFEALNL